MQSKQSRDLDCVICLDLPRNTISCQSCHKLLCSKHIPKLNKMCPHCRKNPFNFKKEQQLQIQIDQLRRKNRQILKKTQFFKCRVKDCNFQGFIKQMQEHKLKNHLNLPIDHILFGDELELPFVPTSKQINIAKFASENNRTPPQGQKKKSPDYQEALKMIRHINNCNNQKCKCLWTGRWGSFIGGSQGNTHFDLTQCQQGKQLNMILGWIYDDVRN